MSDLVKGKTAMNIGYIHAFNSHPPRSGAAVHAYQVTSKLMALGNTIHALEHDSTPGFIRYPATEEGIAKLMSNVDVVYIRIGSHLYTEYVYQQAPKFPAVPVIWEVNSPIGEMSAATKLNGGMKSWLWKKRLQAAHKRREIAHKRYAKRVAGAVCVSKPMQTYAQELLGIDETVVVPNGSDTKMFAPHRRQKTLFKEHADKYKVLWAGSSGYPWQGIDFIPKIAERISQIDPRIVFILITQRDNVKFQPAENLLIYDQVPYAEIPEWVASVDACLCLYHNIDDWCKWGFYFSPLKLFDYMASGKPVIGSNMGQISDVIEDGGNGFLTDNRIEDIVEKILRLANNRNLSEQIGTAARETVIDYYSWQGVVDKTLEFIERCQRIRVAD